MDFYGMTRRIRENAELKALRMELVDALDHAKLLALQGGDDGEVGKHIEWAQHLLCQLDDIKYKIRLREEVDGAVMAAQAEEDQKEAMRLAAEQAEEVIEEITGSLVPVPRDGDAIRRDLEVEEAARAPEICKATNVQNCHNCADLSCGDNLRRKQLEAEDSMEPREEVKNGE